MEMYCHGIFFQSMKIRMDSKSIYDGLIQGPHDPAVECGVNEQLTSPKLCSVPQRYITQASSFEETLPDSYISSYMLLLFVSFDAVSLVKLIAPLRAASVVPLLVYYFWLFIFTGDGRQLDRGAKTKLYG